MREIKYRQALTDFGKFCGWHHWGFIDGKFVAPATNASHSIANAQKHSQEFTGLHDKNGKEIYEGDIMAANSGNLPVCWGDIEAQWSVRINDGVAPLWWVANREVIGNIYENPELINGEAKIA